MTEDELKDTASEAEPVTMEGAVEVDPVEETIVDEVAALEEKLAQAATSLAEAEKLAAEYLDGWQRAQASFANFRKRTESEQAHVQAQANARLLARIVPVMDDFKRAFENIPDAYKDDAWLDGLRLVQRKLKSVLDSENVKSIEVHPHAPFDPNLHEAVLYQEVEGFDEGEIVTEIETGYKLGDRILRPTLVIVAKGRTQEAAAGTGDADAGDAAADRGTEANQA